MLRLYMDVHVKAAITTGVRRRGIDVVTAQEDGSQRLEDARHHRRNNEQPVECRAFQATQVGRIVLEADGNAAVRSPGRTKRR